MSRRLTGLAYWLIALLPFAATAQVSPPLRTWSPAEFGGARQVWGLAQAPDGTIALANRAGVLLFDGVRWRTLVNPGVTPLRTVRYDSARAVWEAGGYDAWYAWPHNRRTLSTPAHTTTAPPDGPREEWWHSLELPGGGTLWQTFSRLAVQKAKPATEGAVAIPSEGGITFAARIGDRVLVPQIGRGIARYDAGALLDYRADGRLGGQEAAGLAGLGADSLLVATRDGRLLAAPLTDTAAAWRPWPTAADQPWTGSQLNGLLRLRTGGYALATVGRGAYVLDATGHVRYHLTRARGLPDDAVLSMLEDRRGNLWLGLDNGLAHVELSGGLAYALEDVGAVYALAGASSVGGFYVGTNQGFYRVDSTWTANSVPGFTDQVWHLTPTPGGLVIGTNAGTFALDASQLRPTSEPRRIGTQSGGWSWLSLGDSVALAGTYSGLERFVLGPRGWRSGGSLPGYNGPVQRLLRDTCRPDQIVALHPQEGPLRLTLLGDSAVRRSTPETAENDCARYPSPARDISTASSLPLNTDYPSALTLPDGRTVVGLTRGVAVVPAEGLTVPKAFSDSGGGDVYAFAKTEDRGATAVLSAPSFSRAPRFRVRLLGIDTAFSPWSTQGTYTYPALASGDYDLAWESDVAPEGGELRWSIAPRWYETWWARLCYLLLAAGAFVLTRRYYHRRLRNEAAAAERERERQLAAERLTRRAAEAEAEARALETAVERSRREAAVRDTEIAHRNRELARVTMALAKQNEAFLQVKTSLAPLPKSGDTGKVRRQLVRLVDEQLATEEDWAFFQQHFDAVHEGFTHRLREAHPTLTAGDLRLASLLRMNLPSKEIAPLLHISLRGVENKRYRLRKKLGLSAEAQLSEWILDF